MHGCPMPSGKGRTRERNSSILLTYFHPWTLVKTWATPHAPHVEDLGKAGQWEQMCNAWLQGQILTEEVRRLVTNYASVTSLRPRERDPEAADSQENNSDVEFRVQPEDKTVLRTKVGGRKSDKDQDPASIAMDCASKLWGDQVRGKLHKK